MTVIAVGPADRVAGADDAGPPHAGVVDVHRTAAVVAALLVATGVLAFAVSDSRSVTALIPAVVGVVVGVLVLVSRRAARSGRGTVARGVVVAYAVVGALAALGSLGRVVPALTGGIELPVAFAAQVATVLLSGWLAVVAVQELRTGVGARR